MFGRINVLQPQASRQFLYCLAPQPSLTADVRLLSGATNIGKLDMVWRSNLGERGRLQTSQLQRMVCTTEHTVQCCIYFDVKTKHHFFYLLNHF